jgi:hypothetical protein
MGQTISYPPLDVVIHLAKFLWFDDIHAFTAVSHTINEMIESETDLWRTLLSIATQRILSIPFCLDLDRTGAALTKILIQRICDVPTSVDQHIFLKAKGPDNVIVEHSQDNAPFTVRFQPAALTDESSRFAHATVTRRSVVGNNCFPCLIAATKVPRAFVPFTKVMAAATSCRRKSPSAPIHTASLSCVAYFEGTVLPTAASAGGGVGADAVYSIGIACAPALIRSRVPGEDSFSFGYRSTSGLIMQSDQHCTNPGEPYGDGDTVGCGMVYPLTADVSGCIFFTKNGILQAEIEVVADNFFSIPWFPVMVRLLGILCLHCCACVAA